MRMAWAQSGRAVLLGGLVLCALRPFAWCGDGAAPGASGQEEEGIVILSPAGSGEDIISCTDAGGRVRIPIFFRMNSAPDQMLSFGKLKLIVLLDGDEHSLVTVSNDAIMLERLQTRSVVEWPHDVMVARGQCYSVSVLVDLPERTSLISASVNFCVGRGASDSCAAAAAATNTAHGTPRRHPEMAPVTISTDAKLVTSDVGSSVLVWLKDHELTAHAQYRVTAEFLPTSQGLRSGLSFRLQMLDKTFARGDLVQGRVRLEFDDAALRRHHDEYSLTIQVWDAFPGLEGDEALLAVRRQIVRCCPRNDRLVINLGLPKTGTTTLHNYFKCGGRTSSHYEVGTEETTRFKKGHPEPETCAACLHRNIKIRDQAPLAGCGDYQAWTQIDDPNQDPAKCFFPQVDAVDALHKHYPDAVYLLPRRDTEDWVRSVENSFHHDEEMGSNTSMADRIRRCPFTSREPAGNLREFVRHHLARTRQWAREHKATLIEYDIREPAPLLDFFKDIPPSCWQHANKNRLLPLQEVSRKATPTGVDRGEDKALIAAALPTLRDLQGLLLTIRLNATMDACGLQDTSTMLQDAIALANRLEAALLAQP